MRMECPFCGSRDHREFAYLGDAAAASGPDTGDGEPDVAAEIDRVYLRDNPAGPHVGLWYHGAGCRSWLAVERDTRTHEILSVRYANEPQQAPEASR